jgi:hypothetical protein
MREIRMSEIKKESAFRLFLNADFRFYLNCITFTKFKTLEKLS